MQVLKLVGGEDLLLKCSGHVEPATLKLSPPGLKVMILVLDSRVWGLGPGV